MVKCGRCGARVPEGKFCDTCGVALAVEGKPAPPKPDTSVAMVTAYGRVVNRVAVSPPEEAMRREAIPVKKELTEHPKSPAKTAAIRMDVNDSGIAPGTGLLGGKLEVLRELGRGGMGIVVEARDATLRRSVAVKRLREELQSSARDKKRFLDEARTVAQLHHPAILDIYDVIEEGGQIYLVLEYIEGRSVAKMLDEGGAFTVDRAVRIMRGICEALSHAHGRGICHLDLKPSNVMCANEGYVKVMDFGIARTVKDTVSRVTGQQTAGTLAYMAPEQHIGKGGVGADIFSAGCTLYEMLTAEAPFRGPDYLAQKREMVYRPASEHVPRVPQKLDEVIAKCLQSDVEKRYGTAIELAGDL